MSINCQNPKNINGRECQNNYIKGISLILYTRKGENTFSTLSAFTSSAIIAAINSTYPSQRILISNEIDDFVFEQEDAKAAIYSSGRMEYIRDSIMKTTFKHIGGDGKTHKAYVALNNADYEAYYFDQFGGMWYRKPEDTTIDQVQGIPISKGSTIPKLFPSNGNDNSEYVQVTQNWTNTLNYSELTYATAQQIGFDIHNIARPLIIVDEPIAIDLNTTTLILDIFTDRGSGITGLTSDNIQSILINDVEVDVISFTESVLVTGRYTLVFDNNISDIDMYLYFYKIGYDFIEANSIIYHIPLRYKYVAYDNAIFESYNEISYGGYIY
jgi:hypothetical protein